VESVIVWIDRPWDKPEFTSRLISIEVPVDSSPLSIIRLAAYPSEDCVLAEVLEVLEALD
jgi:hypothetical protein